MATNTDIAVIVTAINHEATIMEAVESVLSQTALPDSFGVIAGESYDRTKEFIEFYQGEFDFSLTLDNLHTCNQGHNELRFAPLSRLDDDYVLFLPGDSYLYPGAIERLADVDSETDLALGPFCLNGQSLSVEAWAPWSGDPTGCITQAVPMHPTMCVWNVERLRGMLGTLKQQRFGPWATTGWLGEALRRESYSVQRLSGTLGECWVEPKGQNCWTRATMNGLRSFMDEFADTVGFPEILDQISRTGAGAQTGRRATDHLDQPDDSEQLDWISETLGFFE